MSRAAQIEPQGDAGLMTVDEACAYLKAIPRSTLYDYIGRGYFDRAIVRFGKGRILLRRAALDEMLQQGGTNEWRTTFENAKAARTGTQRSGSPAPAISTGKAQPRPANETPSESPKSVRRMRWRDAPKPRLRKH